MKKVFKIILFTILCICDAVTLYMVCGYASRGLMGAKLISESGNAHFVGYYMMAFAAFVVFAVFAAVTIVVHFKVMRKK